jgi:hypothetical protein
MHAKSAGNTLTQQRLKDFIDEIQRTILTSHNVTDRTEHPYFYDHKSIPKPLAVFKKRLNAYRKEVVHRVAEQPVLPLPNAPDDMRNLRLGTFAHELTVALTVALFGIGDCGECATRLAIALIQAGFGDLAFVAITFPERKHGMETNHSLIVANIPMMPVLAQRANLSVYDFFRILPANALIGDAFLGLAFHPTAVPSEFIRYVDAYGGKAEVISCRHFYNVPRSSTVFGSYPMVAEKIKKELQARLPLVEEDIYHLDEKIKIEDTTLISLLKARSALPFFGVCNNDYEVDAVAELKAEDDRARARQLCRTLKGHGRFFTIDRKQIFVLEGINSSEGKPSLGKRIETSLQRR